MTSTHRITALRLTHTRTTPGDVSVRRGSGPMGWLNVALAAAAFIALLAYVIQANTLASGRWQMRDVQTQLDGVRGEHDTLVARRASLDDRAVLLQLAEQSGMVPATAVRYVFEKGAVAAR